MIDDPFIIIGSDCQIHRFAVYCMYEYYSEIAYRHSKF